MGRDESMEQAPATTRLLVQLNNLGGIWELCQLIILLVGPPIAWLIYRWWVKRSIKNLNFYIAPARDAIRNYPLTLHFEITNYTGRSVVISYAYFRYNKLRPDEKARGDTLTGNYEVKFPDRDPDKEVLSEVEHFLRHKETVPTWVPFDPAHTDQEVKDAVDNREVGTLRCFVTWIQERPRTDRLKRRV